MQVGEAKQRRTKKAKEEDEWMPKMKLDSHCSPRVVLNRAAPTSNKGSISSSRRWNRKVSEEAMKCTEG